MSRFAIDLGNTGHPVPRIRGVYLGDSELPFVADDIARLRQEVGVTCIRFGMEPLKLADETGGTYNDDGFAYVRRVLDWCATYDIQCILDLHNAPGRLYGGDSRLWTEQRFGDAFVALWQQITRRLADHPAVLAWELLNEPEPPGDDHAVWNTLARRALAAVREIDRDRPVVVDSVGYARPEHVPRLDVGADDSAVIYSFHNYQPGPYHCQKRRELADRSTYYYPGFIPAKRPDSPQDFAQAHAGAAEGRFWNRRQLLDEMRPALGFCMSEGIPVFCGEFGCVSDVPPMTDAMYLLDQLSIFHEYGVGWTMYNAMWRTTDPYWKDHFDCCMYVDYAPERLLRRYRRKIALLEMVCRADGDTLRLHQGADEDLGAMGVLRPDLSALVLLWNKDRHSDKTVTLAFRDAPAGMRLAVRTMGPSDDMFVYRGAPTAAPEGLEVNLPALTVAAITVHRADCHTWE